MTNNRRIGAKDNFLDFSTKAFSDGFMLNVDPDNSIPVAAIILSYPNSTTVHIRGDTEVAKQIIQKLDGMIIEYTVEHEANL